MEWMKDPGVAEYLGVDPATVRGWRHTGTGPTFYRFGRAIRYKREDVEAWAEANRVEAVA